jgi:hypothetical protein
MTSDPVTSLPELVYQHIFRQCLPTDPTGPERLLAVRSCASISLVRKPWQTAIKELWALADPTYESYDGDCPTSETSTIELKQIAKRLSLNGKRMRLDAVSTEVKRRRLMDMHCPVKPSERNEIKLSYKRYRMTVSPGEDVWYRRLFFQHVQIMLLLQGESEEVLGLIERNGFRYPLDEADVEKPQRCCVRVC